MTKPNHSRLLWGYHPVREALKARRRTFQVLYHLQDKKTQRCKGIIELAQATGIICRPMTAQQMTAKLGHDGHQGLWAEVSPYPLCGMDEILGQAPVPGRDHFLLLLDQVVDPQNFGAIARTAYCTGIDGIILPKNRSAPPTPAASKASAGALEHLRLAYVTNLVHTIKELKNRGVWIVGADHCGGSDLFDSDLAMSLALVIGGEEKGIRPLVKQQCDFRVTIPQSSPFNSLNASAAAAVMLYEVYRQTRAKGLENPQGV